MSTWNQGWKTSTEFGTTAVKPELEVPSHTDLPDTSSISDGTERVLSQAAKGARGGGQHRQQGSPFGQVRGQSAAGLSLRVHHR